MGNVKLTRVNIGCGKSPTSGWKNFDNSVSIRLAQHSLISNVLDKLGLLSEEHRSFINFAKGNCIEWADSTKYIPLADHSVEVLYSSHMIEHLDQEEALSFLKEARRVLNPKGIIRLALPDLKILVDDYLKSGAADDFMKGTYLCQRKPKTLVEKIKFLFVGNRDHHWMYDGQSLVKLLNSVGFCEAQVLPAGHTKIVNPAGLDLYERQDESVYVEAENDC